MITASYAPLAHRIVTAPSGAPASPALAALGASAAPATVIGPGMSSGDPGGTSSTPPAGDSRMTSPGDIPPTAAAQPARISSLLPASLTVRPPAGGAAPAAGISGSICRVG